ncbi:MAG TPA: hypothetical protein VH370_17420 [Humisphaera sp.]|jgi:hypothetical protein|nr:hypothetical protein [Humisphaera sp.]
MSEPVAAPPPPPPKPRKRRRWILRILFTLVAIVLLFAVTVQIILLTNFPRRLVVTQLEKQLGLKVDANSLQTGWLGNTQLQNVKLSLPLARSAFLDVPEMRVKNTSLFGLILGRSVDIKRIELDHPTIKVSQLPDGDWDFAQVLDLLSRAGGRKPAQESSQTAAPAMPAVKIAGGTLIVTDNQQRAVTIQPLEMEGHPESAVSWAFNLHAGAESADQAPLRVDGHVAPGGVWAHQATVAIHHLSEWIKPWNPTPPAVDIDLQWTGQTTEAGFAGRAKLDKFAVGEAQARGVVFIEAGDGYKIVPDNLQLKTGQHILPDLSLASGSIEYKGPQVTATQLMVNLMGGPARVDGTFNRNTRKASFNAIWSGLIAGPNVKHSGSLGITAQWPLSNELQLSGQLIANGTAPGGPFNADIHLGANGSSINDMDWTLDAPALAWHRAIPLVFDHLHLGGGLHWKPIPGTANQAPVLTLTSAALENGARLTGIGSYNFDPARQDWSLRLSGKNWNAVRSGKSDLSFALVGHGDKKVAWLDYFTFQNPDATLTIDGSYTFGIPKPVFATVRLSNGEAPPEVAFNEDQASKFLRGAFSGSLAVSGTLSPLLLEVAGQANGREVLVAQHTIGDLEMHLAGLINGERADIKSDKIQLLGGDWSMDANYTLSSDAANLVLDVDHLNLKNVAAMANGPDISGTLSGEWDIRLPALRFDKDSIAVKGTAQLKDVRAPEFAADLIDISSTLEQGQVTINQVRMQRGKGEGRFSATFNLADTRHIIASAELSQWPLEIPGSALRIDTSLTAPDIAIDLPNRHSLRPDQRELQAYIRQLDLHGDVELMGKPLGQYQLFSSVTGRLLDVRAIHVQLLSGRADGQARVDLSDPLHATAELAFEKVDLAQIGAFVPSLKGLHGQMEGTARLAPSEVSRALEPLALVITTKLTNGGLRTIPIEDATIVGYIGHDPLVTDGGYRLVLGSGPHQTSTIHFDGGVMQVWGRIGRHPGEALGTHVELSFQQLDLDRLVHDIDPAASKMPGKLAGNLTLLYATSPVVTAPASHAWPVQIPATQMATPATQPALATLLDPLYADGEVRLRQSNLTGYGPIGAMYDLMHLGKNSGIPTGTGNVGLHLERGTLSITHLRYFDRGKEIRAVATANQIWNFPNSPISGSMVGTAQPLANTKLPLLADIDSILTAVQKTVVQSITLYGTVHEPKWRAIVFGDIGGELQRMIVGDVRSGAEGVGE